MEGFGLEVDYVDMGDAANVAAVVGPKTRLVFLETIANPATQVPDLAGIVPPALGAFSRLRRAVKPWSMIEVFVLAALVSIGRLDKLGDLDLHPAFWALAAMMFLIAIADSIFDERTYWADVAARPA